jgi:tRNA/tmRNA/rRNA uracil-C5-methylase (TrmA/RlmC/RlmD family)
MPRARQFILDPPATGLAARVVDLLLGGSPSKCSTSLAIPRRWHATWPGLASAYTLDSVTPLDMFPQTAEIEVVAHLVRALH